MLASFFILLWLAPTTANAEWFRAESANFVVYSEGEESDLVGRVRQLEEFDRLLRMMTGTEAPPSPNKLNIYMVRGRGQLDRILQSSAGLGGFYAPSPDGIVAVVDQGWREDWMTHEEVLLHEYSHHFMMQYFPASYPAWYVEGFAEYLATIRFADAMLEIGRFNPARASWLADRSGWLPLDTLLFGDPTRLNGAETAKFYAQSWLLVHYLMRDADRRGRLARYLAAMTAGAEPRTAFAEAFATDVSTLQREISRYGGTGMTYSRLPRISAAEAAEVEVVRLAGVPDELILARASLQLTWTPKVTDRFLGRALGAADGDGALARRVRARAEALYGDGAAADRQLDSLLAEAPGDVELLYLKGMRHLVAGRRDEAARARHFAEAKRWFVRAHRADENHFPTLYRYAESLSLEPDFLSENTSNILLLAHQIAPQVEEIAMTAANVLIRRGEYDRAAALLVPVGASRHRGRMRQAAVALLAKAQARDNRDLPDPFAFPDPDE
ncbi:hypothetical protein [Sphingosinicella sp. CPCC 101087]|uniref:hypothetical protein n=1 Tax=Sphingosinicella sp. CPCC 101087 TaxID=2497754 RepID=UPI00101D3F13|nr:hypothetical protein [Sphingosinicella sp. CPCC 101087]